MITKPDGRPAVWSRRPGPRAKPQPGRWPAPNRRRVGERNAGAPTITHVYITPVPSSEALTRGVRVVVNARYSSSHSDPAKREWFFLYTVTITNEGDDTVQLVNRHWVIMNANGHVEEVRGPGVVGNQPTLKTGESFEYTSGCPLKTPFGSMHGSYEMVTEEGEAFLAEIAPFALRESETFH